MTGMVDILLRIFRKMQKIKIEAKVPKKAKLKKNHVFSILRLNFQLFCIFSKMRLSILTLPVILSFMPLFVDRTFFYFQKGVANLHKCWQQKSEEILEQNCKANYVKIQFYQPVEHKICKKRLVGYTPNTKLLFNRKNINFTM